MTAPTPLLGNPAFLADLEGAESARKLSERYGLASSAIVKYRKRLRTGEPLVRKFVDEPAPEAAAAADGPAERETEESSDGARSATWIRSRKVTLEDARAWIRESGDDPDDYVLSIRTIAYGADMWSNRMSATPKRTESAGAPAWPVVQPAPQYVVPPIAPLGKTRRATTWKTAVLGADSQIGFRNHDDGSTTPFHDEAAINVFLQVVDAERPDTVALLGDIIDLPSQSRWAQEASFAQTTQRAIDRTGLLAAELRQAAGADAAIVWLEGNHDKRMQNYVETNALAAFGLRRANLPNEWPVMSLPNLLRLSEHGVQYQDAYPAAHWWLNDKLRLEHGTKANSKGSTASQYANETPHISRAFGHTHRLEVQSKTTWDRLGKIRSMAINPGCLCRVDGAVPSVNGAIGVDGKPATVFEDWQNGCIVIRYRDGDDFFLDGLVQIDDGRTVHGGQEFIAATR